MWTLRSGSGLDVGDILGDGSVDDLLDEADRLASWRRWPAGRSRVWTPPALATLMPESATICDILGKAGNYPLPAGSGGTDRTGRRCLDPEK